MRERPRINLHKLGNAFLGDPATHFIRRRQFAALFPGFESAARAHDQLARWKSFFWPFSLTVTVRGPLKFKKNLGVDRVVVPCQLSLGRVWIRISGYGGPSVHARTALERCRRRRAAAAAEGLSARAAGCSAAPRLARGMNPTMDLERAITPISLSW
jgi:hypothetical protein